jgi:hypothetical protein
MDIRTEAKIVMHSPDVGGEHLIVRVERAVARRASDSLFALWSGDSGDDLDLDRIR